MQTCIVDTYLYGSEIFTKDGACSSFYYEQKKMLKNLL